MQVAAEDLENMNGDETRGVSKMLDRVICCRTWAADNLEARGFVFVGAARGPISIYGALFASVAIAAFALSVSDCDGRILGGAIKASSILSSLGVIEGVLNSLSTPLMGTFADVTPHRKRALGILFSVLVTLVLAQAGLFISKESDKVDPNDEDEFLRVPLWQTDVALMVLVVTVVVQVVCYELVALLTITYAPELSSEEVKVTEYVGMQYGLLNAMQLLCAALITAIGLAFGVGSLQIGMIGGVLVTAIGGAWFLAGFKHLGDRKELTTDFNTKCCGLGHIWETLKEIWNEYPEVLKLLVSWAFSSAGVTSMVILATSYLQFYVGLDGTTTSAVLSLALLMSVPGAFLIKRAMKYMALKTVYLWVNVVYGLSFVFAPLILKADTVNLNPAELNDTIELTQFGFCDDVEASDAEQTKQEAAGFTFVLTLAFTIIWGLCLGGIYVGNNAFYAGIIPGAKESSFYGIKTFFGKALTFLPSLLYTSVNEAQENSQYSIMVLAPFYLLGAAIVFTINVDKAKADIDHTLHLRRGDNWAATGKSLST